MTVTHRAHNMMTSSNGTIFRVTGPLCGEFTGPCEFPAQWPVTRSFDVFFDLRLNKRLSKHSCRWWVKTLSRPLWRHCNVYVKMIDCYGWLSHTGLIKTNLPVITKRFISIVCFIITQVIWVVGLESAQWLLCRRLAICNHLDDLRQSALRNFKEEY